MLSLTTDPRGRCVQNLKLKFKRLLRWNFDKTSGEWPRVDQICERRNIRHAGEILSKVPSPKPGFRKRGRAQQVSLAIMLEKWDQEFNFS